MTPEVRHEFRQIVGKASLLDAVAGPIVFAVAHYVWGVEAGVIAGLAIALAVVAWRLVRKGRLTYAFSGVGGTVVASVLVGVTGRAEDYYLPGIISGAAITVALVVSLIAGRPLVGIVSSVTRGWPLDWYQHPRVKPAYRMATAVWAAFFGFRALLQFVLYRLGEVEVLAGVRVATGWPALAALLAGTYWLGRRRLESLSGPSVAEWEDSAPPPWKGQTHGF